MGRKIPIVCWIIWMALSALVLSFRACPSGYTLHIFMANRAIGLVDDPHLQALLEDERPSLIAGVALPDGGYVNNFPYAEFSHWPAFHVAYFDYVYDRCHHDLHSQRCRRLIANMLGVIAHGFQDEAYDTLMYDRSRKYKDKTAGNETIVLNRDLLVDKYVLQDHGYLIDLMPVGTSPLNDVFQVFQNMGLTNVTYQHLVISQQMVMAFGVLKRMATNRWSDLQDSQIYPWLRHNYQSAAGGVDFTARALANLWNFYWDRLHNTHRNSEPTVFPGDGGAIAIDPDDPWRQIYYLSDRPIYENSFDVSFHVIDRTSGTSVGCTAQGRNNGHMFQITPTTPLIAGHQYQIFITTKLRDYWRGAVLQQNLNWTVTAQTHID